MRKASREVKGLKNILEIIRRCEVARLGLNDDGYPYIVPLNFGIEVEGEVDAPDASLDTCRLTLCFHGASAGKKYELMERDARASFEMDCGHQVVDYDTDQPGGGHCTFMYECVMGRGTVRMVTDEEEKLRYLTLLTDRYHQEHFAFNRAAVPVTNVFLLTIEEMTAKRRPDPRK